jgi:DNA-binding GntR family transcriptional regulator
MRQTQCPAAVHFGLPPCALPAILLPVTPPAIGQAQPLPLYIQISELLTRQIAAGHWQDGERLPTEAELAPQLGVAVGTLRKALAELESRGMLARKQGSGTYVRTPREGRSIYEFFRLELKDGVGLPTAQVLSLQRVKHPAGVPRFGAEPADGPAFCQRVRRLRYLDRVPVALEEIWFDARHAPSLKVDALSESLYLYYRNALGFWISRVEDHLGLGHVPDWAPPELGLAPGAPACCVARQSWAQTGALEEYSLTWFNSERARYAARWR